MNQQAKNKIVRARAALILDQPFFGTLALRMGVEEATDIETMATDGRKLMYNPEYVNQQDIGVVKTLVCHEVMHNVLDHVSRLHERDMRRWNFACDYAINPMLKDIGMRGWDGWLCDDVYKNLSADHIYSLLPPMPPDGGGPNHMKPNPKAPPTAKEKRDWKIATAQAAQAAKMMGKLPGPLEQFIDNLLENKVDWREVLRQFITQQLEGDYSWLKPNRMMLGAHDVILPGLFSERTKPVAVFKDISASIDDVIQDAFNAEVRAIVEDTRPEELHVMYVDTRVGRYDRFKPDDQVELVNLHGGGTDFRPPFQRLAQEGVEPACAVYLTDMEGVFPAEEPPYPVLWVSINKNASEPPFGTMLHIEV